MSQRWTLSCLCFLERSLLLWTSLLSLMPLYHLPLWNISTNVLVDQWNRVNHNFWVYPECFSCENFLFFVGGFEPLYETISVFILCISFIKLYLCGGDSWIWTHVFNSELPLRCASSMPFLSWGSELRFPSSVLTRLSLGLDGFFLPWCTSRIFLLYFCLVFYRLLRILICS